MDEVMDQKNENYDNANVQTIGQLIAQARENANLTVKELSKSTKIGITMLELLEADELGQLPNRAYVSGYIKSCCKELGINQQKALEVLEDTYRAHGTIIPAKKIYEKKAASPKKSEEKEDKSLGFDFKFSAKSISVIVLVIFILLAYNYYRTNAEKQTNASTESQVETEQEVLPKTVSETTPLLVDTIEENKAQPAVPVVEKAPAKVEVAVPKVEKKVEVAGKKSKYETNSPVSLNPIRQKLFSVKETPADKLSLVPNNYQQSVVPGKQNLYIIASTDSSWLTYKKDNEDIKALKLKKGEALFLTGDEFRLFFGNINSTTIFLNNQLLETPSSTGVKSLVFPESSNSKFKLPLFVYLKDGRIITSEQYEAN